MSFCPKCRREFPDSGGFCPYDGVALVVAGQREPTREGQNTSVLENRTDGLAKPLAPATYDHLIGAELEGRYHIEKKIGEGGMGVVFLARHIVIEKLVAIKILRREVAIDKSVVKRFVQEARAASRIGHPNIIDVTDFGTTPDGMTYQVMEYVEGQTLNDLLKKKKTVDLPRALNIVAQIARALEAAHEKGIVHRDLKPDNVFLIDREDRFDFVKIVDFGIAKVSSGDGHTEPRLTRVGSVFGTPEYMAPEQAAGRADVDQRADIYALGIILYEMLVGRVPHKGETTVRTLAMQMLDPVQRPRSVKPGLQISDDLEAAMMKALAKKRHDRYSSMGEFLEALEDVTTDTELNLPLVVSQERQAVDPSPSIAPTVDAPMTGPPTSPSEPRISDAVGPHDILEAAERTRRRKPRRTDPAFVADTNSLPIFDEIGDDEDVAGITDPQFAQSRPSRVWLVALLLLLAAGGATAVFLMTRGQSTAEDEQAQLVIDAASEAHLAPSAEDAATLAQRSSDAGGAGSTSAVDSDHSTPDAALGVRIVETAPPDSGPTEATVTSGRPNNKTSKDPPQTTKLGPPVEVTVRTDPPGGELFIKDGYAGSDGLNVRRPSGTKLTIACKLNGYQTGAVTLTFGEGDGVYLCKMRKEKCTKGLMNPFDKCPD